jgi:hypothetical protein
MRAEQQPGPLDTPPAVFIAQWASQDGWEEPIEDIAWVIACEAASEWGLDIADPGTRVKVFGQIERYSHAAVERALGLHPDPANIDWERVAHLTGHSSPAQAQTAYQPEQPL